MLNIPSHIASLLKSKIMVGDNRPAGKVILKDAPIGGTIMIPWSDGTKIREDQTESYWTGGSFVRRSDGLTLVTYGNYGDGYIYLATVIYERDIFQIDNISSPAEWQFVRPPNGVAFAGCIPSRLFKRRDGTILLLVLDPGKIDPPNNVSSSITVYKSENGLGNDFEYYSTIPSTGNGNFAAVTSTWEDGFAIGVPITLRSGRIILAWNGAAQDNWPGNYRTNGSFISYSDDNGQTWTTQCLNRSWTSPCKGPRFTNIAVFNGSLYAEFAGWDTFQNVGVFYSHDDGATWGFTRKSSTIWEGCFWGSDGYNYYTHQPSWLNNFIQLYRRPDTDDVGDGTGMFDVSTNWELLRDTVPFQSGNECVWITENHWIAVVASGQVNGIGKVTIWGVEEEVISIPIKSITVDRSKGSASQATVVLDNMGGIYAPDPEGEWHQVIWPNNTVEICLGYGAEQQLVFTGFIDELTMSSYPAEISFTARDYSKLALDQMVQTTIGGVTTYTITYTNRTPEYVFHDLSVKAGFGNIFTEVSGLTIEEITFSQEMYADAFQRLAELVSFEWFCDETGAVYFRRAVEPDPAATYVFREGEDIFSLDYTISDAEIYADVVVMSQDAEGNGLAAVQATNMNPYYKLPPQKTLIIQATDLAATEEQCRELAVTAANALKPKPRQVSFVVVGMPYLQIGDCLQVIESSSTISEIYRVFELTHQMSADGSPVFATTIKCYHYAAG